MSVTPVGSPSLTSAGSPRTRLPNKSPLDSLRVLIKVPKQLGIAGIGNASVTDLLENKLTTVNTNQHLMGKLAASKLIDRINGLTLDKRIIDVGTSIVKGFSL